MDEENRTLHLLHLIFVVKSLLNKAAGQTPIVVPGHVLDRGERRDKAQHGGLHLGAEVE